MLDEKYLNFIQRLTEKTKANEAAWERLSRETEFALDFQSARITTDRWASEDALLCDFVVYNERGDKIYNEVATQGSRDFAVLDDLYQAVSRSYYKVDQVFDSLFKEVESNKKIGEKEPQ